MADKFHTNILETAAYAAGIRAYGAGVRLAALRNQKARKLIAGHRDTLRRLASLPEGKPRIWIHAASLGEFEQARPIIEAIRKSMPDKAILLTFFSPSGYEVRKDYPLADTVCYLPFDTAANARRFVEAANPEMAIFVKYEIWRNYLLELYRRHIPAVLVSAAFRPDQAFFRPLTRRYGRWLTLFSRIFVQDDLSRRLLDSIGIASNVAGDTRFDRVAEIRRNARQLPEIERFATADPEARIFVSGSSWQPDEEAYIPWLAANPGVRSIIAPHEFDNARIHSLLRRLGPGAITYSDLLRKPELADNARHLVIDCFGILSSLYRFATAAYIGGGFGAGIHNINEAAVYGIPVIFGPNYHRFVEAEELIEAGGALTYSAPSQFAPMADALFSDTADISRRGRASADYIASRIGATPRILCHLFPSRFPGA